MRSPGHAASLALVLLALQALRPAWAEALARWTAPPDTPAVGGGSFPPLDLLPFLHGMLFDRLQETLLLLLSLEVLVLLLPAARRPRPAVLALAQVLVVVGMVGAAELDVRQAVWPHRRLGFMAPDAARYWAFNRHNADSTYSVNSHGLRGLEIVPKEPGEFRVLCLGDSISAGQDLAEKHTYPFVLQGWLRKRFPGRLIRVQNGAVNGYSILQGTKVLEKVRDEFRPDVVIVEYTHSNLETVDRYENAFLSHRWPLSEIRGWLFESMLYLTLRQTLYPTRPRRQDPYQHPDLARERRLYEKYARWFVEQSRRDGFRLVFYVPYLRGERLSGGTADVLRAVARAEGIPLVDLDEAWRRVPDIDSRMQDDSHPDVEGTVLQAEDIGRFLVDQGLIDRPKRPPSEAQDT